MISRDNVLLEERASNEDRRRPLLRSIPARLIIIFLLQLSAAFGVWFVQGHAVGHSVADPTLVIMVKTLLLFYFASAFAFVTAEQMSNYPGSRMITSIAPIMMLYFGMVVALIGALRLDYSRVTAIICVIVFVMWVLFDYLLWERNRHLRIAATPEDAKKLAALPKYTEVVLLTSPRVSFSGIDLVAVDLAADRDVAWQRMLTRSVLAGIPVYDVSSVNEALTGRVKVEQLLENGFHSAIPSKVYLWVKRVLDLALAILAMPVFLTVIAVAAIAIKLETPGPVFFRQARIGLGAREFTIWKLRSMYENVEGDAFTAAQDSRVTKVGRLIRQTRIDEFPQIFNVILGDLSWIGPRPEAVELAAWYSNEIPFYNYRHAVRPGISGWAQINQGNVAKVEAAQEKLEYDFFYIKHYSFWLDFLIVLRTLRVMATGFGSK